MPKKKTREVKRRVAKKKQTQMGTQSPSIQKTTTKKVTTSAPSSTHSVANLSKSLGSLNSPQRSILTQEQQVEFKRDIIKSLVIALVLGIVLFGVFLFILNAVQS